MNGNSGRRGEKGEEEEEEEKKAFTVHHPAKVVPPVALSSKSRWTQGRPVTVPGLGRGGAGGAVVEEAFYLPRGVTNTLHISSNNTVRQVIVALLNKFTVADNPAKYALYKRYHREEQVYVCKLADGEQPMFLRLVAGPDTDTLSFVLREQQTGEVMWDAFSIPELRNFLRILDKEEEEQKECCTVTGKTSSPETAGGADGGPRAFLEDLTSTIQGLLPLEGLGGG
ncbi:ras association domain-containing protein 1 isoform X1 [Lates japonicus]|uniref:Ras association domain-containing protein 1 isoform X1 n=1 Tax=Lates japonicus TaxID=270547 RepID=A0AAD3NJE3_LATJO|nr:ras association domain-containing protein 1 isoform X1 [Lates japonicus]